jgi:hypothetical protein
VFFLLTGAAVAGFLVRPHPLTITRALDSLSACFTRGAGTENVANTACLESRVTTLLTQFSTHDIMSVINTASTSPATVVRNCHLIGHLIGHKTYLATPDLEQAFSQCTINCRHACMHGAVTEAVNAELGESYAEDDIAHADIARLQAIGRRYCDRGRLLCHAVGHLIRMNSTDYQSALSMCDTMGENTEMCYSGVFMEDASVIESSVSGHDLKPAVQRSYDEPCASLPPMYKAQCYRYLPMYQSTLFTQYGIATTSAQLTIMKSTCTALPRNERDMCIFGIGAYANRLRDETGSPIHQGYFCDKFSPGADRDACEIGIVRTIMTTVPPNPGRLFAYCDSRSDTHSQQQCYFVAFKIAELTAPKYDAVLTCVDAPSQLCGEAKASYSAVARTLPQFYFGPDGE